MLVISERKSRENESPYDKEKPSRLINPGNKDMGIESLMALTGKLSGGLLCEKFIK